MTDVIQPGWHPDPFGQHANRYYDGATWTEHVADGAPPAPSDAPPPPPPPAPNVTGAARTAVPATATVVTLPDSAEQAPHVDRSDPTPPNPHTNHHWRSTMPVTETTPGWYPDPHHHYELRYHDGRKWTDHVSSGGVQITDPESGGAEPAATVSRSAAVAAGGAVPASLSEQKRQQMAYAAMACGGAMMLANFLPWASGSGGSVTGFEVGAAGYIVFLCGAGIVAYGYQALRSAEVRYHPGALTAIIVTMWMLGALSNGVDDLNQSALGSGDAKLDVGSQLAFMATLVAVWPLVVFWKAYRRQRAAEANAAGGGRTF